MRGGRTSFLEDLINAPWWISIIIMIVGNGLIRIGIPAWFNEGRAPGTIGNMLRGGIAESIPLIANMFTAIMLFTAALAFIKGRKKGR